LASALLLTAGQLTREIWQFHLQAQRIDDGMNEGLKKYS
jgi:hypothetical protein